MVLPVTRTERQRHRGHGPVSKLVTFAVVSLCAVVLAACSSASASTDTSSSSKTAAAPSVALHVNGSLLVDSSDKRVILKGVTDYLLPFYTTASGTADPTLASAVAGNYAGRDAAFAAMKADGYNTVRVPLGVGTFINDVYGVGGSGGYLARIKAITASAQAHDLRVIFCWWNVLDGPAALANVPTALAVMHTVATALRGNSDVLFEPVNEPFNLTWAQWQPVMQTIVTFWRTTIGYTGPLIVDTTNYSWAFDPTQARLIQALDTRLLGGSSEVVFANHRYANSNTCFCGTEKTNWEQSVGRFVTTFPLLGTEYGWYNNAGAPSQTWNAQLFNALAKTSVPQGFNGALAFVWHWIDDNSMTTNGTTLNTNGTSYQTNFIAVSPS
jgi:hypothetical protein